MTEEGALYSTRHSLHKSAAPLIEKYQYDVTFIYSNLWYCLRVDFGVLDLFQEDDKNQEFVSFIMYFGEEEKNQKSYFHLESFLLLRVSHTETLKWGTCYKYNIGNCKLIY